MMNILLDFLEGPFAADFDMEMLPLWLVIVMVLYAIIIGMVIGGVILLLTRPFVFGLIMTCLSIPFIGGYIVHKSRNKGRLQ